MTFFIRLISAFTAVGFPLILTFLTSCSQSGKKQLDPTHFGGDRSQELIVGTTGDYPPFSWWDEESYQYKGIDIELAQRLADQFDKRLRIVPTSWQDLALDLDSRRFDLILSGVSITDERKKSGKFSKPYYKGGKVAVGLCENKNRYKSLEQMNTTDVRIAVNKGGTNEIFVKENFDTAKISYLEDNLKLFHQLESKSADVIFTDDIEARFYMKDSQNFCFLLGHSVFAPFEIAAFVSSDFNYLNKINQMIDQLSSSGDLDLIFGKYLSQSKDSQK